jgi:hypothetical protein
VGDVPEPTFGPGETLAPIKPGEAAARARLDALFATFDRLTPDELGRLGIGAWDDESHEDLLDALEAAAKLTGRDALVDEARARAGGAVLQRYSSGTLHPTWVGLNWGLSQGTVEDRVAIVEVLSDAAAAAAVADVLDPDDYAALLLPAERLVSTAGGNASEGSLARQLDTPVDPELGRPRVRQLIALLLGLLVFAGIAVPMLDWIAPDNAVIVLAGGLAIAGLIVWLALRRSR